MPVSRRTFLTAGGTAAIVLAVSGGVYRYRHPPAATAFVLTSDAAAALRAIIPAMLAGALPDGAAATRAIATTLAAVQKTIAGLPLASQQELQGLFSLLALAPVRRWLAGVPIDWAGATPAQVSAFLQSWRLHRFADLRVAYAALHDIILGAWYADPAHWAAIDYPGPLAALANNAAASAS